MIIEFGDNDQLYLLSYDLGIHFWYLRYLSKNEYDVMQCYTVSRKLHTNC